MEHVHETMPMHDHGGHGGHGDDCDSPCADMGHSHAMVFHANVCQEILFSGWLTTTALQLFGSCVAIFVGGVLYEALKYYREVLHIRATTVTADSRVNIAKNECGSTGNCNGPTVVKYSIWSCGHAVQTALHVVQATASYVLMLVFMTYNVYLCLALVAGLGLGYFIFGWRKTSLNDANEHCQ
ncbi:unnamed protein product [Chilo suppressalis]|uniref:Copper transport protein n=1 Tax=Chilo suppressalis TaxID=168631 RepID=A0ABN8L721_CHISP|nr:unnamed protein product [Chilo suppressalis]